MRVLARSAAAVMSGVLIGLLVLHGVALATTTPRVIDNVTTAFPDHVQVVQMSADASVIAFSTTAMAPAVPETRPGSAGWLVYTVDLNTSQVEQINVDSDENGAVSNGWPGGISVDGRYVAYTDWAAYGFTGFAGAFLRDRVAGTTDAVSLPHGGGFLDGNTPQGDVDVSDDGRYVVFSSYATNILAPGQDTNGKADVFLFDRVTAAITRVSVGPFGVQSDGDSVMVEISGDGSTIAYISYATNLLGAGVDSNGVADVFVVDRSTLTTERVSVATGDAQGNAPSQGCELSMTPDGEIVAFQSDADNLVPGDTNFTTDVFVRNRLEGTTVRASVGDGGAQASAFLPAWDPEISADGTKIAFATYAPFDAADGQPYADVYLRDLVANTTELISRTPAGQSGNNPSGDCNNGPTAGISADGEVVAFNSSAGNLAPDGDADLVDIFVSRPTPPDSDGDGIANEIDTAPGTASTAFSDGSTFGAITAKPASYVVTITDALLPSQGIRVTVVGSGSLRVKLDMCGTRVYLAPGANVVLTCGSVIVDVDPGSSPVQVEIGDPGVAVITVPPGAEAEIEELPGGGFTIENVAGGDVTVVVDGVETVVEPGETLAGKAWDFQGFAAPIDNGGVLNSAKAGRVIPVRWRILDASGAPVVDLASATLSVQSLACPGDPTVDQLEEYTAGASGLINQGNGNYQLNWQTPTSYAGSCKTLRLDIGDGVVHTALFRFGT